MFNFKSFYIFLGKSFIRYVFCKYFLPVCSLPSHSLNSVFHRSEVFRWSLAYQIFLSWIVPLVVYFKSHGCAEVTWIFSYIFFSEFYRFDLHVDLWSTLSSFFLKDIVSRFIFLHAEIQSFQHQYHQQRGDVSLSATCTNRKSHFNLFFRFFWCGLFFKVLLNLLPYCFHFTLCFLASRPVRSQLPVQGSNPHITATDPFRPFLWCRSITQLS